ncbi:hypothetical protein ACIG5E_10930 [Kitasatospora sp. NPDC053057]
MARWYGDRVRFQQGCVGEGSTAFGASWYVLNSSGDKIGNS